MANETFIREHTAQCEAFLAVLAEAGRPGVIPEGEAATRRGCCCGLPCTHCACLGSVIAGLRLRCATSPEPTPGASLSFPRRSGACSLWRCVRS